MTQQMSPQKVDDPSTLTDDELRRMIVVCWQNNRSQDGWGMPGLIALTILNDRISTRNAETTNKLAKLGIVGSWVAAGLVTIQILMAIFSCK